MIRKGKRMLAGVLAAVCLLNPLGAETALAEKTVIENDPYGVAEGITIYDVGTTTEDGIFEIKSDSTSLNEGDTVEVQIWYHESVSDLGGALSWSQFYVSFDSEVLKYDSCAVDENILSGGGVMDDSYFYDCDNMRQMCADLYSANGGELNVIGTDVCLMKLSFKVLKTATQTTIGVEPYQIGVIQLKEDGTYEGKEVGGRYQVDEGDNKWQDRMTLTIPSTQAETTSSSLALSSATVQGTDTVTVPIRIAQNDGFNALGLTMSYDTSLFTYDSLTIADSVSSKISLDSTYNDSANGQIKASFIALDDVTATGDFLYLKLKAKQAVTTSVTSNIGVTVTQVGNKKESAMTGTGTTASVTLVPQSSTTQTLGDVNNDGVINLIDAVYILQYYNHVRDFTSAQLTAADVNKAGGVTLVDALMIMKYYNGELKSF